MPTCRRPRHPPRSLFKSECRDSQPHSNISCTLLYSLSRYTDVHLLAWFVGHFTLLLCVARYGLSYITFNFSSKWASFSYRTAFVAAVATYGIVVYKAFRARVKPGAPPAQTAITLLGDENVQYLRMWTPLKRRIQADNFSHLTGMAHQQTDPARSSSIQRLLCLPRRYLYSHKSYPNIPASQDCTRYSCRTTGTTTKGARWLGCCDRQIRQGIL